jgi:hypothetical protein
MNETSKLSEDLSAAVTRLKVLEEEIAATAVCAGQGDGVLLQRIDALEARLQKLEGK